MSRIFKVDRDFICNFIIERRLLFRVFKSVYLFVFFRTRAAQRVFIKRVFDTILFIYIVSTVNIYDITRISRIYFHRICEEELRAEFLPFISPPTSRYPRNR